MRAPFALGLAILIGGCQKRPEASTDRVDDTKSRSRQAQALPQGSAALPAGSAVFRVWYGYVVMSPSTPAVQRTGAPRLIYRRDDHGETFLAESEIEERSLDVDILALRGVALKFYGNPQQRPCESQIDKFKVIAWAMPQDSSTAPAWDDMPDASLAKSIFDRGSIYIAGVVGSTGRCPRSTWAAESKLDVRFEEAQPLELDSQPTAILAEPAVPYLQEWDTAYAALDTGTKSNTLPPRWRELPITTRVWGFAGPSLESLRVVNFERNVTPELIGRPNEPSKPWFSRGGVAVWKVSGTGTEFVGPHRSVLDESEELRTVTAVHVGRESPLISLTSSRHFTILRKAGDRFEVAEELSIAPAP